MHDAGVVRLRVRWLGRVSRRAGGGEGWVSWGCWAEGSVLFRLGQRWVAGAEVAIGEVVSTCQCFFARIRFTIGLWSLSRGYFL